MKIVAFLDSCVLYPFTVRDLLIQFSYEGMFRAKWSSQVRREVIKNVEHDNHSAKGKLGRTFDLMEKAVPDFSAESTGVTSAEVTKSKTDKNDIDILAAAIDGGCTHLVTSNLRHFDIAFASARGISVIHPDEFIERLINNNQTLANDGFNKIIFRFKNPPRSKQEYCDVLKHNQLVKTSEALENL